MDGQKKSGMYPGVCKTKSGKYMFSWAGRFGGRLLLFEQPFGLGKKPG